MTSASGWAALFICGMFATDIAVNVLAYRARRRVDEAIGIHIRVVEECANSIDTMIEEYAKLHADFAAMRVIERERGHHTRGGVS